MIRYTTGPTKYDVAPYKTVCILYLNDDGTDRKLYIQISHDESNPVWITVEELVIKAYQPYFEDPLFLDSCLDKIKTP